MQMKLDVTQENLAQALTTVGRVAGGRTSLPILSNILMTVENNRLKVSATNLELAITKYVGGKVEKAGALTVPARLMTEFVSSLPSGNINIEAKDNKLQIKSENYKSTINGIAPDDFPSIPDINNNNKIKISASDLKQAISQTVVSASYDESRPILTGLYLYNNEGKTYLAATDSYRLSEKLLKNIKTPKDLKLVIPAKTLNELHRILGEEDEEVEITHDESQVQFVYGDVELVSKLVEGKFPEYKQLIPEDSEVSFTIGRDEFQNITKVASLFARESAGSVTLKVDDSAGTVSIASVASQVGENTSVAKADIKGSGEVTLNSRYLLDALNVIESDKINFRFSGKVNPCILTPAEKAPDYLHVIMPLRS